MINKKKKIIILLFTIFFITAMLFLYETLSKKKSSNTKDITKKKINSNIILDVQYTSQDKNGNIFTINAKKGEIDINQTNIIFLSDVYAIIQLNDSNIVEISSNFGKYNINNYETIFSKNVIVNYLDNKITGEYLDFSLIKNLLIINRDVVFSNTDNILFADNIKMNLTTKDINITMFEKNKRVKVRNKN